MKKTGLIDGRRISGFTLGGSSGLNGMYLPISDISTIASGYMRGMYINYTSSGTKTGGTTEPLAIDFTISGNVSLANCIDIYMVGSGTPSADSLIGIYMYLDDPGSGVSGSVLYGMRMQVYGGRAAVDGCFSLRRLGSTPLDFVIQLETAAMATYFIKQDGTGAPFTGGSHTSLHGYYTCYIAGNVCYIPLYT